MAYRDPFAPEAPKREKPSGDCYLIDGVEYPRVTHILSRSMPGGHLLAWYAKQTALLAAHLASKLPGAPEAVDPDLVAFAEGRAQFSEAPSDVLAALLDFNSLMKEPERYRDFRGWIGSCVHQVRENWINGIDIADNEIVEHCEYLSRLHRWVPDDAVIRCEEAGKNIHNSVAWEAATRWRLLKKFYQDIEPDFLFTETTVYHPEEMYAGTLDGGWTVQRKNWIRSGFDWPFGDCETSPINFEDLKNSKSLSDSVRYQLAAYARATMVYLANGTSIPMPYKAGALCATHVDVAEMKVKPRIWFSPPVTKIIDGVETEVYQIIEDLHEAFCLANQLFRLLSNKPKAVRSRAYKEPRPSTKRGQRECPIQ